MDARTNTSSTANELQLSPRGGRRDMLPRFSYFKRGVQILPDIFYFFIFLRNTTGKYQSMSAYTNTWIFRGNGCRQRERPSSNKCQKLVTLAVIYLPVTTAHPPKSEILPVCRKNVCCPVLFAHPSMGRASTVSNAVYGGGHFWAHHF